MSKFRKKPVAVEAVQVTDEWFDGEHPNPLHLIGVIVSPSDRTVLIDTLDGQTRLSVGDWIITHVHNEHYPTGDVRYPCTAEAFEANYEPA